MTGAAIEREVPVTFIGGRADAGRHDRRQVGIVAVRRDNQDETGATIRMRLAPGVG